MFRICARALLCAVLCATAPMTIALENAPAGHAAPDPAAPALLPANAVVELEMVDAVSSQTSKRGDLFHMRVVQPLRVGERELVPAGTVAVGQVVHAQKSGAGGRGGELILAARFLEMPQGQVKLRASLGAAGAARVKSSLALSFAVGPLALFVKGKTVSLPAGAALSARIAADTLLSPAPVPGDSVAPTP
jgi:hypothetical protein